MVDIAIISNEPTPYRLHVLRRLSRELTPAGGAAGLGVRVHNVFTHRLHEAGVPWRMRVESELHPVFFADLALAGHERDVLRASRLFHRIRAYLVEHRVKLVILLGYNDVARLRLVHWARRAGVPLLLNADSNVYSDQRIGPVKRWVKRAVVGHVVNRCAGLMPMGRCGQAYFRLYARHDKPTFLFPYEADYDALANPPAGERDAFLREHRLDPERHRLLYCGRLVAVKGVDVLLEAFTSAAGQRPEWDLVIAGDGPLRGELERRVPEGLRERVRWLGFLQFEQARACYHCCDVLVHPSLYEPWGVVVSEAAACGLAIIATDVTGSAAELVRHRVSGLLTPAGDASALARAILEATEGHVWRQMKSASGDILKAWRSAADPVQAVRAAMEHWKVGA